jgi:hypothetical protein
MVMKYVTAACFEAVECLYTLLESPAGRVRVFRLKSSKHLLGLSLYVGEHE